MSRHAKPKVQNLITPSTIASIIVPELGSPPEAPPPLEAGESPPHKKAKTMIVKVWPKPDTHGGVVYRPPDKSDPGDGAPSMV